MSLQAHLLMRIALNGFEIKSPGLLVDATFRTFTATSFSYTVRGKPSGLLRGGL